MAATGRTRRDSRSRAPREVCAPSSSPVPRPARHDCRASVLFPFKWQLRRDLMTFIWNMENIHINLRSSTYSSTHFYYKKRLTERNSSPRSGRIKSMSVIMLHSFQSVFLEIAVAHYLDCLPVLLELLFVKTLSVWTCDEMIKNVALAP